MINSPSSYDNHYSPNPNPNLNPNPNVVWGCADEKELERLIVASSDRDESTRWERIAAQLGGGKTAAQVEEHRRKLVYDVELIESGLGPCPSYSYHDDSSVISNFGMSMEEEEEGEEEEDDDNFVKCASSSTLPSGEVGGERKKGSKWTLDEHRLFLIGLKKYNRGDWRSISRNLVTTRSPTQVASHAQKYFLRLESGPKHRKRSSIHDITDVDSDSLADLFRRRLLHVSNLDDDSLANLVRQGLISSAHPVVDMQSGMDISTNYVNYVPMPSNGQASYETFSNYGSQVLQFGMNFSRNYASETMQSGSEDEIFSNYGSPVLQGMNISRSYASTNMQSGSEGEIFPNYGSLVLQSPGMDISRNYALTTMQSGPEIFRTYAPSSASQEGSEISPNYFPFPLQPSPPSENYAHHEKMSHVYQGQPSRPSEHYEKMSHVYQGQPSPSENYDKMSHFYQGQSSTLSENYERYKKMSHVYQGQPGPSENYEQCEKMSHVYQGQPSTSENDEHYVKMGHVYQGRPSPSITKFIQKTDGISNSLTHGFFDLRQYRR